MNNAEEFSEKLNILKNLEIAIRQTSEKCISSKCYTDLFAFAAIDRALKLSKGLITLVESANAQCAAIIARAQLDNLARFHGLKLVPGGERKYVYTFLHSQKRFSAIKDKNNKQLTDKYLIEKLNEAYPEIGFENIYKELCNYAHLSQNHHRACSIKNQAQKKIVEIQYTITRNDIMLEEITYLNLINLSYDIGWIFLHELERYFSIRENFPNNDPLFVPDLINLYDS